ncbi:hypothetical protein RFI_15816 [Reticulomyxa filosa]|uniref:Uncharacterized protein n=1 Tax=Reticulomyxa filosa TaxID=46433 RepID=X6N559_RETFI|nr:hypothetical protein RFI_15816 [Reticulomyxa filosa]|eukprot:ETO21390.1 hypothetical protein RFI_15816 [Reticulomyxa filosa]
MNEKKKMKIKRMHERKHVDVNVSKKMYEHEERQYKIETGHLLTDFDNLSIRKYNTVQKKKSNDTSFVSLAFFSFSLSFFFIVLLLAEANNSFMEQNPFEHRTVGDDVIVDRNINNFIINVYIHLYLLRTQTISKKIAERTLMNTDVLQGQSTATTPMRMGISGSCMINDSNLVVQYLETYNHLCAWCANWTDYLCELKAYIIAIGVSLTKSKVVGFRTSEEESIYCTNFGINWNNKKLDYPFADTETYKVYKETIVEGEDIKCKCIQVSVDNVKDLRKNQRKKSKYDHNNFYF